MKTIRTALAVSVLAIFSLTGNGQDNSLAEAHLKTADAFEAKSDASNAIVYYEKAALEFQKNGNTERAIDLYNQIGTMLNRQDKYDQAKSFLEKALAIGRAAKDPESLAIATTYITLGVTYGAEDQFDQSLIFHHKALSIRLRKLGENSAEVATSYGNIGNIYFRKKDYAKAIAAHRRAERIRAKVFGKKSVEIAESYRGLGNAYREKKDYRTSLSYFEKALTIKIVQLGPEHKDLVRYYKSMGEVYQLMGNRLKSEEYRIKGEEIERRIEPPAGR